MKPSQYMSARVEDGTVVITSQYPLQLIGATCPTLVPPSGKTLDHIAAIPTKGRSALLAVVVRTAGHGDRYNHGFVIFLYYDGHYLRANLEDCCRTTDDAVGSVVAGDAVTRTPNSIVVTTKVGAKYVYHQATEGTSPDNAFAGYRLITDADLLLRYLNYDVTIRALEEASGPDPRSAQTVELEDMRRTLEQTKADLQSEKGMRQALIESTRRDSEKERAIIGGWPRFRVYRLRRLWGMPLGVMGICLEYAEELIPGFTWLVRNPKPPKA